MLAQGLAVAVAMTVVERAKVLGFVTERAPEITFLSLYGLVTVVSPYMTNKLGETARPVNRRLAVHGRGRTLLVERAMTDFGMDVAFERASRKFEEHYGIKVGRTTMLRVVEGHGERAVQYVAHRLECELLAAELDREPTACEELGAADEQEPPGRRSDVARGAGVGSRGSESNRLEAHDDDLRPAPVDTMLAELDGCEIRTGKLVPIEGSNELTPVRKLPKRRRETDWRDVRVGLVRPLDSDKASYAASLGSYDDMVARLEALGAMRGARRNTTWVKVVDGGNGLREALDRKLSGPTILDKPHCRSHLFDAAKKIEPDIAPHPRVNRWTTQLASGSVDAVIAEVEGWRPPDWTEEEEAALQARETLKIEHPALDRMRQLAAHLHRFHDAVQYDDFKAAGYPIGDGEVESAHRVIPQPRLKLPGTWWLPENVDRILALRVLRENGWWDDFWAEPPSPRHAAAA